jgi:hypothetical protein
LQGESWLSVGSTTSQRRPCGAWNPITTGARCAKETASNVTLTPGFESAGVVDAVTGDATAVWVELDGGRGRTLVHVSDGVAIVPQTTAARQEL